MLKKIALSATVGSLLLTSMAFAQNATSTQERGREHKTVDGACMASAVDKRDSAIISAFDVFSSNIKTALATRKNSLKTAWVISDAKSRRQALREVWKTWNNASRAARKDLNKARRDAWSQFNTDRKACGTGSEDQGSLGSDNNL